MTEFWAIVALVNVLHGYYYRDSQVSHVRLLIVMYGLTVTFHDGREALTSQKDSFFFKFLNLTIVDSFSN